MKLLANKNAVRLASFVRHAQKFQIYFWEGVIVILIILECFQLFAPKISRLVFKKSAKKDKITKSKFKKKTYKAIVITNSFIVAIFNALKSFVVLYAIQSSQMFCQQIPKYPGSHFASQQLTKQPGKPKLVRKNFYANASCRRTQTAY